MHPSLRKRVHSLRNSRTGYLALVFLVALWTLGCETNPPQAIMLGPNDSLFTASGEERSAALAVLDSLQQTTITAAFDRLGEYAFTHRLQTAQRAANGAVVARATLVRRFPPPDSAQRPLYVHSDTTGTFDGGWLRGLTPAAADTLINRAQHVLSDEPAYLETRTQEAFRYRLQPDTTFDGRTVRVVEVHAEPGELGADQVVRHARLFVEPATNQLVGLTLTRANEGLLFQEDSRARVRLQPAPDSGWVPAETQIQARLKIPFREAQELYMNATFSTYRSLP